MTPASDPQKELHIGRLRESLEQLLEWRKTPGAARTQGFQNWRERTKHSLMQVFGRDDEYTKRFSKLSFCVPRMVVHGGTSMWTQDDERACREDIYKAEQLLKDALEEAPGIQKSVAKHHSPIPASQEAPAVVVQVLHVLAQQTSVDVRQLVASIEAMPLDQESKRAAEEHVRLLEEEARGQHRWSVMAKSLDFLKGLGKGVYEKVALPLLLEIIKRQAGLGPP